MDESEHAGVKKRSTRIDTRSTTSVIAITDHRMPNGTQVDADLMSSTGFESTGEKRGWMRIHETLLHRVVGNSRAAALHHRHASWLTTRSSDRCVYHSGGSIEYTPDQSGVDPFRFVAGHLANQFGVRLGTTGHHQQTGRTTVEAMDDARTMRLPHRGDLRISGQDSIDESGTEMSGPRMHYQTRRLVDHQHVIVLVLDMEYDTWIGAHCGPDRFHQINGDDSTGGDTLRARRDHSITDPNGLTVDETRRR